jgi:hypothetical protein
VKGPRAHAQYTAHWLSVLSRASQSLLSLQPDAPLLHSRHGDVATVTVCLVDPSYGKPLGAVSRLIGPTVALADTTRQHRAAEVTTLRSNEYQACCTHVRIVAVTVVSGMHHSAVAMPVAMPEVLASGPGEKQDFAEEVAAPVRST